MLQIFVMSVRHLTSYVLCSNSSEKSCIVMMYNLTESLSTTGTTNLSTLEAELFYANSLVFFPSLSFFTCHLYSIPAD